MDFASLRWERSDRRGRVRALAAAVLLHLLALLGLLRHTSPGEDASGVTRVVFVSPPADPRPSEPPPAPAPDEDPVPAGDETRPDPSSPTPGSAETSGAPRDPDMVIVLEDPDAGPDRAPRVAGAGGVSLPEVVAETFVEPVYPDSARGTGAAGWIVLRVVVLEDGTLGDVEVLHTPQPGLGFEESMLGAVRQWRFQPSTYRGRPVRALYTLAWEFKPPA